MGVGAVASQWYEYRRGWKDIEAEVIEEASIALFVNGEELVTIMATPREQDLLALGFLKNEGFIDSQDGADSIFRILEQMLVQPIKQVRFRAIICVSAQL